MNVSELPLRAIDPKFKMRKSHFYVYLSGGRVGDQRVL